MSVFQELKRRNVIRVAVAYLVSAWLALQVVDLMIDNLDAPVWLFKVVLVSLVVCFPIALMLAWAFELTSEDVQKDADVDPVAAKSSRAGRKLDVIIVILLAVSLGYFIWESRFSHEPILKDVVVAPGQIE